LQKDIENGRQDSDAVPEYLTRIIFSNSLSCRFIQADRCGDGDIQALCLSVYRDAQENIGRPFYRFLHAVRLVTKYKSKGFF
jgi:hypothetical protein